LAILLELGRGDERSLAEARTPPRNGVSVDSVELGSGEEQTEVWKSWVTCALHLGW
jgi:hypothetical protein